MNMLSIIKYKNLYFLLSILLIVPGIVSLWLYGLKLSIDFTGGTRLTYVSEENISDETVSELENIFISDDLALSSTQLSENQVIIRTVPIDQKQNQQIEAQIVKENLPIVLDQFESIGPTIGQETTLNAVKAVAVAALLIIIYIAFSFRKVPKPTSSWKFGVTAIVTLLHDVLILLGAFSIFGVLFGVEIDSLFITALLTIMGFSVHDTIVVFDRIRENLIKGKEGSFSQVVNDSILQTLTRSLNTSITALLVLFGLFLFGGESIRWFVVALLIGITVGTYSSIFNAAPLLVLWNEVEANVRNRRHSIKPRKKILKS